MASMTRNGWLRRVGPWVGIGTSPAALMMGGGVAEKVQGAAMLAAIAVGVLLLAGLAAAQGLLGQRERPHPRRAVRPRAAATPSAPADGLGG